MTAEDFIAAVRTLTGLPPVMIEQLVALAPKLSDKRRAEAMAELQKEHGEILTESRAILASVDEGMKEITAFRRTELPKIHGEVEADERAGAEHILDDDASNVPA